LKRYLFALLLPFLAVFGLISPAMADSVVSSPYVWRDWSTIPTDGFKTMLQYFTVSALPTSEGWFAATSFKILDNTGAEASLGGYFGWQSKLLMPGGSNQTGVIFSIWGGTSAYNTGCVNGQAYSGTEQGASFYSYHCVINLQAGHRYMMYVTKDSPTATFVRWYYRDMNVDAHSYQLATIGVPSTWRGFGGHNTANWIEHYSGSSSCTGMAYAQATFEKTLAYDWSSVQAVDPTNTTNFGAGCTSSITNNGSGSYTEKAPA
jgi:hypothetical protein